MYEPFVDCLSWMCHEDSAFEVCFCKDIGKCGGMVEMKTSGNISSATWSNIEESLLSEMIWGMGLGMTSHAESDSMQEKRMDFGQQLY